MNVCEKPAFMGYGGSTVEFETKVYTYREFEIRIPMRPGSFPPDQVTEEYPWTVSGYSLDEAMAEIDELLDDN